MTGREDKDRKAVEAIKVDSELYQFLTPEILEGYLPLIFNVDKLEGDYIARFEKKAEEKGIEVNEDYIESLWETGRQVPGVDLRSGEYGIDYAGAGFYHTGCQFYDKGDLDNALANLKKAIELCPRNILARSLKALIHVDDGDLWLAIAEAGNAILLNPVSIAERDSGSRAILETYPAEFSEVFRNFLARAYNNRGSILYNSGNYEAALADFNEAVRRDPNALEGVEKRLSTYMYLERWEEALADCDLLIAAGHEKEKTLQYRDAVLKTLKRYKEANS